jgi:putative endonuclease
MTGRTSRTARTSRLGRNGEAAVAEWYEARGFEVLARNWRCRTGELDLVLSGDHGALVVFCEVKTRLGTAYGSPFEAVTSAKQRRLRQLAGRWMAEAKPRALAPERLRVDVAAVQVAPGGTLHVEVVEDAC